MRFISHCHSLYSHDCSLKLFSIYNECQAHLINAVILSDHDTCKLSSKQIKYFQARNFYFIPAIEFTTIEGIHIIGVGYSIKNFEKNPKFYDIKTLVSLLKSNNFKIIIPHPSHQTGIFTIFNFDKDLLDFVLLNADAYEVENYRYGKTSVLHCSYINKLNPSCLKFIGSDAHTVSDIATLINILPNYFSSTRSIIDFLFHSQCNHLILKNRSSLFFFIKKLKKNFLYQFLLNLFDLNTRIKVKKFLYGKKYSV